MDIFIIGDVHGCFFTFLKLLENWDPKREKLIQVGDLVDRGNFSPKTIRLAYEIQIAFGKQSIFLRGNHEQMMVDYLLGKDLINNWKFNGGAETLIQFEEEGINPYSYLSWIKNLPLFWENKKVFISHAGISEHAADPFDPNDNVGVLWNRKHLKNIGKLQVIGHTPRIDGLPEFIKNANCWNIDTGAYRGICLTGIKLKNDGSYLESISIPTDPRDID
ncbi:metallophosphoesterase family protein [Shivajiella indica]|uniref:Metallophosphoesterase family protein n=1 Tax=Shivajiella indica TaxID=872115 RepID=A0ABW5BFC6_9BACT